jgi:hypothetical protein
MNIMDLYCHPPYWDENPFFAYFSTVDTRFHGYDNHDLRFCVTSVTNEDF